MKRYQRTYKRKKERSFVPRNYERASCICPVCKSNYYIQKPGRKLVHCCGTRFVRFHEDSVESEGDLVFAMIVKNYNLVQHCI
jgi:hypothetical protein